MRGAIQALSLFFEMSMELKPCRVKNIDIYDKILHILGGTNMFWIGMIVGIIIATIVIVGFIAYACWVVYGSWNTFEDMCYVTMAASENRESEVRVYHDGEILDVAVFEEM